MSSPIKTMLEDMRRLCAALRHSLVALPNYAIAQRCTELDEQIEAVEALQADADFDMLVATRADANRYRALRSCALEPDSALAASMDAAITGVFQRHGSAPPATYAEFDSVVDAALAAAEGARKS